MPSERPAEGRSRRDRDGDRDRHRSRHPRERSRERDRDHARGSAREDRPRDRERRHRSRSRERDQAGDKYGARDHRGRDDESREVRKRDRSHDQEPRRARDEPAAKASRHRSPDRPRDSRRLDTSSERDGLPYSRPAHEEDAMDEDGALPPAVPSQPQDLNFDADITPEEMQMMASMGIPFGFDTTQGKDLKDDKVNAGAIKVKKNRLARQYMNRRGGFNRPLPAERTGEKTQVTSTR